MACRSDNINRLSYEKKHPLLKQSNCQCNDGKITAFTGNNSSLVTDG